MDGRPAGGRQRLFVAVPLPSGVLRHVEAAQRTLPAWSGLRLLRPEQMHLTIAFMGEVGADKAAAARTVVEEVTETMGGVARLGRISLLPSARKARVVVLDVDDDEQVLSALYEGIMGGLEASGVMRRDERPFRPHLTIARLKRPGLVQPMAESVPAEFAVESVCLYESELRREGAVYHVVVRTALICPDARAKA